MVKHWFRNTLFKERQRNKDSPYNFNNPPSTTLNLEEYERTGQTKVTSLSDETDKNLHHPQDQAPPSLISAGLCNSSSSSISSNSSQYHNLSQAHQFHSEIREQNEIDLHRLDNNEIHRQQSLLDNPNASDASSVTSDRPDFIIKSEPLDHYEQSDDNLRGDQMSNDQNMYYTNYDTKSESGSSEILSRPQTPTSAYSNINEIINQQIDSIPINNIANLGTLNNMGPPKKFQLNKIFEKSFETNSNSSSSSTSSGKRANRTRFTDYQIKVLQEFFENNSYPKDSDLEYLSKLLLLSPRVIVVWFQVSIQTH